MLVDPDTGFRISMMGIGPWEALVRAHRANNLVPEGHEDDHVYWRASGVMDAEGRVDPDWVEILDVVAHSPSGLVMVAQEGELALLSNVHLDPELTVVIRFRGRVEDGQVTQMEPMVEVAACFTGKNWTVLQRVLPPGKEFRAEAGPGTGREATAGPASDRDSAADPDASLVVTTGGPTIEAPGTLAWYSTGGLLHRVQDGAALLVEPGDVARGLAEQVTLALRR